MRLVKFVVNDLRRCGHIIALSQLASSRAYSFGYAAYHHQCASVTLTQLCSGVLIGISNEYAPTTFPIGRLMVILNCVHKTYAHRAKINMRWLLRLMQMIAFLDVNNDTLPTPMLAAKPTWWFMVAHVGNSRVVLLILRQALKEGGFALNSTFVWDHIAEALSNFVEKLVCQLYQPYGFCFVRS